MHRGAILTGRDLRDALVRTCDKGRTCTIDREDPSRCGCGTEGHRADAAPVAEG